MKKLIVSMMLLAGLAFWGAEGVNAQATDKQQNPVKTGTADRPGFTDANGDGICDYYNGKRAGKGLGPGNGQGLGRGEGKGLGDAQGLQNGAGRRSGEGRGAGLGKQLRDGSGSNCNTPK